VIDVVIEDALTAAVIGAVIVVHHYYG